MSRDLGAFAGRARTFRSPEEGDACAPGGDGRAQGRGTVGKLSPTRARIPRSAELIYLAAPPEEGLVVPRRPASAARVAAQGASLDGEDAGPRALPLYSSGPAGRAPAHRGKQGGLGLEGLQESRDRGPRWLVLPWPLIKPAQHPGPAPAFSPRPHFPGSRSLAGPGRGLVRDLPSGRPLPTRRARRRARRGICGGTAESPGPSGSGEGGLWRHLRGKS